MKQLQTGEKLIIENIDGNIFYELHKPEHNINDVYAKDEGVIYGLNTIQEGGYRFFWNDYTERQFKELPLEEILKDRIEVSYEEFVKLVEKK